MLPEHKRHLSLPKEDRPPAFTLMELLVVISVITIISAVAITAISPRRNLQGAQDAKRLHDAKELQSATYQHLIYEADLPDSSMIGEGESSKKPICKSIVSDEECAAKGGISFGVLPPSYIAALPVDPLMPANDASIGYEAYTHAGRPIIVASNVGKLPGDTPSGLLGYIIGTVEGLNGPGDVNAFWPIEEGAGNTTVASVGDGISDISLLGNLPDNWYTHAPGEAPTYDTEYAISCDGDGDNYAISPDFPALGESSLSVSMWLNAHTMPDEESWYYPFSIGRHGEGGSYKGITVRLDKYYHVQVATTGGQQTWNSAYPGVGGWFHLAVVMDREKEAPSDALTLSDTRLYINGIEKTTIGARSGENVPLDIIEYDLKLCGCKGCSTYPPRHFNGMIDLVAVYNRALTPAEVQQLSERI